MLEQVRQALPTAVSVNQFSIADIHRLDTDDEGEGSDLEDFCTVGETVHVQAATQARQGPGRPRKDGSANTGAGVLKRRAEKEARLPATRAMRMGAYNPVLDGVDEPSSFQTIDPTQSAAEDPDDDRMVNPPQVPRRKVKTMRLDKKLAKEVNAEDVMKNLLEAQISVPFRSLLGLAPSVSKLFYNRYPIQSTLPVDGDTQMNLLQEAGLVDLRDPDFDAVSQDLATAASPKVLMTIGQNGKKVTGLIDSGAECNLMSVRTARELGIPMEDGFELTLTGATGRSKFAGAALDVDVTIGSITTPTHFFLSDRDLDWVILGRPFERRARLRSQNCDDGSWEGTIFSQDGELQVTFRGVPSVASSNRRLTDIARIPRSSQVSLKV